MSFYQPPPPAGPLRLLVGGTVFAVTMFLLLRYC